MVMGERLELTRIWEIGDQIGAGGFGRVFEATGDDGTLAAVKFIAKAPGAGRELLFEDLSGARNVIPILDRGERGNEWVIVMPRAEMSLRQRLAEASQGLPLQESVRILRDVVDALVDLQSRVVHRDIKPENTLKLGDHWCLADFGIARYAEASTAPDTRKFALTPAYAAPERWRTEHVTAACDVYSLGVMAYEVFAGHLPFPGPQSEDFRQQHLDEPPPAVPNVTPSLASLVTECLYKSAQARPTAANLAGRIAAALRPAVGASARLQEANKVAVERESAEAARESAARSAAEKRAALVADAAKGYEALSDMLRLSVLEAAPKARVKPPERGVAWALGLNDAVLELGAMGVTPANPWGNWKPAFDVAAHCQVGVGVPRDRYEYEGRSHSLWFCDAQVAGAFRWFETAFMISPLIPQRSRVDPFGRNPGEEAGKAIAPAMTEFQVAWPFTPIDQGDEADFLEHWIEWFARGALGELVHPPGMPERRPDGSWRR
jgi:serine/threonine-protein kinase